ncbi:ABC transporter permease subunit [Paraburkholderia sp. CNPSo 3155]|uniref:ABC transporter permease n=1 Tax=Paraburkholderia atlantica TaxID=2654982 RepID=UPI00128C9657|nr:ABC transporter permease [Paraburkholderia atlantica]MPW09018.1 ABC transporter permease subunit [Paraburkholderia atlantica]
MTGSVATHPTQRGAIFRRLAGAVVVLWAAVTLTFISLQLIPGDIAAIMAGQNSYEGLEDAIRKEWQLDQPWYVQYVHYVARLFVGDFGRSYVKREDVSVILGESIGPTIQLALTAGLIAVVAAIAVSLLTAGRNRALRSFFIGLELLVNSIPVFWSGLVLLVAFSVKIHLFPISGADGLSSLVLPAIVLALPTFGLLSPVLREAMERALDQPFSLTALSRGIGPLRLRTHHALRHGLVPTITLAGWLIGQLLGGTVVTETVFSRPGLGTTTLQAVLGKDVPVVFAVVLIVALVYVVTSTLVDLSYAIIDPRTKGTS